MAPSTTTRDGSSNWRLPPATASHSASRSQTNLQIPGHFPIFEDSILSLNAFIELGQGPCLWSEGSPKNVPSLFDMAAKATTEARKIVNLPVCPDAVEILKLQKLQTDFKNGPFRALDSKVDGQQIIEVRIAKYAKCSTGRSLSA